MDLDEQIRRTNRHYLIGVALLYAGCLAWLASLVGIALALIWTAPVLGSVGAYWLVKHGAGKPFAWLKRRAYAGTAGEFHAYDDLQVRVRWGGVYCEVAVIDVFNVLRIPKREQARTINRLAARYPEGVCQDDQEAWWFSEAALLDWLTELGQTLDQHVLRFKRWFEKETFPALRRKVELGLKTADHRR